MSQAKLALQLKVRLATIVVLLLMAEGVSLLYSSELRATVYKYSVYHKLFGTGNIQFAIIVEQLNQLNKATSVPGDATYKQADVVTVEKLNEAISKVPDDFLLYQFRANRLEAHGNRGMASEDRAKAQMFEQIANTRSTLLSTIYLAGLALFILSLFLLVQLGKWLSGNFLQLPTRLAVGAAVTQNSMLWLILSNVAGGPLGWMLLGVITGVTAALIPGKAFVDERFQFGGALNECARATSIGVLIWLVIVACAYQFFFGDLIEFAKMIQALGAQEPDASALKYDCAIAFCVFSIFLLIVGFFSAQRLRRSLMGLCAKSEAGPPVHDGNFKQ